VCNIPGDECGGQGGVQGDTNCDEESCDRRGDEVSDIRNEDMDDKQEDECDKRVAVKVSLPGTVGRRTLAKGATLAATVLSTTLEEAAIVDTAC
jgi:hypothetical protein